MPRHPWNDPRPFVIGPTDARRGALLVHGFTGAPTEVLPLGRHLAARGFRALGVQLPGHGSDLATLVSTRWQDWLGAVEAGRDWLEETCDEVVVCGLSMGALLGCVHAASRPPDALVLLAPAFEVSNPLFSLVGALGWLPGSIPAPSGSGLTSTEGWKQLWHYERRPFRAARELLRIQKAASAVLPELVAPTLVIQGDRDQALEPTGADRAFEKIGAQHKRLVHLAESGHIATADVEAALLFEEVDRFLDELSVSTS